MITANMVIMKLLHNYTKHLKYKYFNEKEIGSKKNKLFSKKAIFKKKKKIGKKSSKK